LYKEKILGQEGATKYKPIGKHSSIPKGWWPSEKLVSVDSLTSQGPTSTESEFIHEGKTFSPPSGMHWKTTVPGLYNLVKAKRIVIEGNSPRFLRFIEDFPVFPITNLWTDIGGVQDRVEGKIYVVQTSANAIERAVLMTTDPGDLVFDITCGSGTTAKVAEEWGRRWITCDTSRVAVALTKQRLMISNFDYYELAHPKEGISSGFRYRTVPHVTLKSIANNELAPQETLYDQPFKDTAKVRITGPFTVEAVPAPQVRSLEEFGELNSPQQINYDSIGGRSGETLRQSEWRDELLRAGIRAKGGVMIEFARIETMKGTTYIQAEGETKDGKKALMVFGPEFAPLEQKLVENAWQEARNYKPDMLIFCAFQFDDEAAKDIDELDPKKAGMLMLKVQMNADLLTDDLLKKRRSNESFWLIGQPDVEWEEDKDGNITVEVRGFDYYNPKTGDLESGGKSKIAMWMLDTDYDERSIFPSQVFFPISGDKEGWNKLAKNLRAEIDEELIEAYRGTTSLPFEKPNSKKIAVKIIDDRGIESLRVIKLK
jgi:adenine-specific DNA-methyltransferase